MQPLPPAIARLETLIAAGAGDFVAGTALAKGVGIPVASLAGFIGELRRCRPDLVIEGRRGHGYRLTSAPSCGPLPPPPLSDTSVTGRPATPTGRPDPLDLFMPPLAEIVRDIALVSGETVDATIARLVAYGVEVHRELVMSGENPLALACPRGERQPGRRNKAEEQRRLVTPVPADTRHSPSDRHA
jgi:hypothetical protein